MTSKMQDIYFPHHAQLSLYGIFPREKCHAIHGVQKFCLVYVNRDMDTNINSVCPCLQSTLGRVRVAFLMKHSITLAYGSMGPH